METVSQKGEIGVWIFKLIITAIAIGFFWFFCSNTDNLVKAVGSTMGGLVIISIGAGYFIKNDGNALLLGMVTSTIGFFGSLFAAVLFRMIESTIIVQVATCCTVAVVAGSFFFAHTFKVKGEEYKVSVSDNIMSTIVQAVLAWEGFYYVAQWIDNAKLNP